MQINNRIYRPKFTWVCCYQTRRTGSKILSVSQRGFPHPATFRGTWMSMHLVLFDSVRRCTSSILGFTLTRRHAKSLATVTALWQPNCQGWFIDRAAVKSVIANTGSRWRCNTRTDGTHWKTFFWSRHSSKLSLWNFNLGPEHHVELLEKKFGNRFLN